MELKVPVCRAGRKLAGVSCLLPHAGTSRHLPGFLSTFTVNSGKSYAQIDKPIYEKVQCTIPLYFADDNGLQLDVFHDINIDAEMLMNCY